MTFGIQPVCRPLRPSSVQLLIKLSDGVGDLQPVCGDELRELLQTLDEPNLPAELLTDEGFDHSDESFDVPGRMDDQQPLQVLLQPPVNGGVALVEPFDGWQFVSGSHGTHVNQQVVLRDHQI